ncbi:hypothetical protein PMG11_01202 [Penicillium brasilianum]|uniref:Arrestin-like N-terminal domain-containing protein n=1 Tax=Penicillium brasilianum TaxID=104259 RepID=A0A0F7THC8_PENBI|nr:hypothetical protein PMG11_01202 [Penicillium brasilianum]
MASQLNLECPSSHDIYFNLKGEAFSQPIFASVLLRKSTDTDLIGANQVRVSLVRVLSGKTSPNPVNRGEPFLKQFCRLLSSKTSSTLSETAQSCQVIEELMLCVPTLATESQVGYSPPDGNVYKIPFHMPIKPNIPASAATDLGKISYFLAASVVTTNGNVLGTSKEMRIIRQLIPDCNTDIQHTRKYPNAAVVSQISLTQQVDATDNSKVSLHTKVSLRTPRSPINRSTEFKCVAIRGIRWRVEEITKLFIPSEGPLQPENNNCPANQPTENQSTARELCNGFQKGYWGTLQNPIVKERHPSESNPDSPIEIKFDIRIPKDVTLTPEVCLSNYTAEPIPAHSLPPSLQRRLSPTTPESVMLTVEHRLRFNLLTSEDTFDVDNRNLVDRKPLRTVLDVSFPLYLYKVARGRIEESVREGNPPSYGEVPLSPPDYQHFA